MARRLRIDPGAYLATAGPVGGLLTSCEMDAVLSVPLFVGVALAAVVALVLLGKTRLFWLPGIALMGYGVAIYVAWPWYDTRYGTGLEGLSNLLHVAVTCVVIAGGSVCLLVGARSRKRTRRTDLPTAIVTNDPG